MYLLGEKNPCLSGQKQLFKVSCPPLPLPGQESRNHSLTLQFYLSAENLDKLQEMKNTAPRWNHFS